MSDFNAASKRAASSRVAKAREVHASLERLPAVDSTSPSTMGGIPPAHVIAADHVAAVAGVETVNVGPPPAPGSVLGGQTAYALRRHPTATSPPTAGRSPSQKARQQQPDDSQEYHQRFFLGGLRKCERSGSVQRRQRAAGVGPDRRRRWAREADGKPGLSNPGRRRRGSGRGVSQRINRRV